MRLGALAVVLGTGVFVLWHVLDARDELVVAAAEESAPVPGEAEYVRREIDDATPTSQRVQAVARGDAHTPAGAPPPAREPLERKRAPGVYGRVVDVLGYPLANATVIVRARRKRLAAVIESAHTDTDGRYAIVLAGYAHPADLDRLLLHG